MRFLLPRREWYRDRFRMLSSTEVPRDEIFFFPDNAPLNFNVEKHKEIFSLWWLWLCMPAPQPNDDFYAFQELSFKPCPVVLWWSSHGEGAFIFLPVLAVPLFNWKQRCRAKLSRFGRPLDWNHLLRMVSFPPRESRAAHCRSNYSFTVVPNSTHLQCCFKRTFTMSCIP